MAESPRRVDLRLTIPASAPFREIGVELAVKFAQYVGASTATADTVSKAVAAALDAGPDARAAVDLELSADGADVTVTARPSRD